MNQSLNLTEGSATLCNQNEPETVRILKLIVILLLFAFGMFGNLFTIVLAGKYTERKSLHFLIINMSTSDAFLTMAVLGYYIKEHFLWLNIWEGEHGVTGDIICKTRYFFSSGIYLVSLLTLLVISFERYRITRRNALASLSLSSKKRVVVIVVIWLLSLLLNLGSFLFDSLIEVDGYITCKTSLNPLTNFITSLLTISGVIFCCFMMVFINILTLRRLSNTPDIEASIPEPQRQQRRKRIKSAIKLVLYSLLVHSLCYLLDYSLHVLEQILLYVYDVSLETVEQVGSLCIDWSTLYFFALYFLPLVNTCLSPVIYFVCLSDFREAARRLLCGGHSLRQETALGNSEQPGSVQTIESTKL